MSAPTLSGLRVYPVKGARGRALTTARVAGHGLADDREWLVMDPTGRFLSQRTHPGLARLEAHVSPDGVLSLDAPGHGSCVVRPLMGGALRQASVWDDAFTVWDAGDEAAAWLSAVLGTAARLGRCAPQTRRFADREYVGDQDVPITCVDGFPLLVCSEGSLDALNERLPTPVPMDRFRPNLVVAGWPAFAEDRIHVLRIGTVRVRLVKPCTRCAVPAIDQVTGSPSTNPLPALKAFRFDPALRGVTFGVNAVIDDPGTGTIERGMPVTIES